MVTLCFVVPAYRRVALTEICLSALKWTCDTLEQCHGIRATAVVVADDENLETARALGFGTVRRENNPLGRKFNDGIEFACRVLGVDFVVPCGTDNWVLPAAIALLPDDGEVVCRRWLSAVSEDGSKIALMKVTYQGGDGIRTFPASTFKPLGYRPAAEDKNRAIDGSIWDRLVRVQSVDRPLPVFRYRDISAFQVVSFQSPDVQLNKYDDLYSAFGRSEQPEPWRALADHYPSDLVARVRAHYGR